MTVYEVILSHQSGHLGCDRRVTGPPRGIAGRDRYLQKERRYGRLAEAGT